MNGQRAHFVNITLNELGLYSVQIRETLSTEEDYVRWGDWKTRVHTKDVKNETFEYKSEEEAFENILNYWFKNKILRFEIKDNFRNNFKDLSQEGFEYSLFNEGRIFIKLKIDTFLDNIFNCPSVERLKSFIIESIRNSKKIDMSDDVEKNISFEYIYSKEENKMLPFVRNLMSLNKIISNQEFKLDDILEKWNLIEYILSLDSCEHIIVKKLKELKSFIRKSKCVYFATSEECVKVDSSAFDTLQSYNHYAIEKMYELDKIEAYDNRCESKNYWDIASFDNNKTLVIYIYDIYPEKYNKMDEVSKIYGMKFNNIFASENEEVKIYETETQEKSSVTSDEKKEHNEVSTLNNNIIKSEENSIKQNIEGVPKFEPLNPYNDTTKICYPYKLSFGQCADICESDKFLENLKAKNIFDTDIDCMTIKDMKVPDFNMYPDFIYYLHTYYTTKSSQYSKSRESQMLINFKEDDEQAFMHYLTQLMHNNYIQKCVRSGKNIALCNIPSHMPSKYSQMDKIVDYLYIYFKKINPNIKRFHLVRKTPIQKLAYGGKRDVAVHYNSISLSEREKAAGYDVLLLDDVFTTGNSLNACVKILYQEGAKGVSRFAFAKTYNEKYAYQIPAFEISKNKELQW